VIVSLIVVADTTPLNYLILMGRVEILNLLYGRVLIPDAVLQEILAPRAPLAVRAWARSLPDWVEVANVNLDTTVWPKQLGAGEVEAIHLALERRADIVMMDDQAGRRVAEQRGLFVSGTLAVLLQAARLSLLDFDQSVAELEHFPLRYSF
jgi:predicted nucleic acid-binding protein